MTVHKTVKSGTGKMSEDKMKKAASALYKKQLYTASRITKGQALIEIKSRRAGNVSRSTGAEKKAASNMDRVLGRRKPYHGTK